MNDLAPASQLAIGIDLGATKIAAALVTRAGELVAHKEIPTLVSAGQAAVLDRIAGLAEEMISAAGERPLIGIGIGSPGEVDAATGVVRNAVNLGWQEVYLAAEIQGRISKRAPVLVQIDAHASALGECLFGAGRGCADLVYLGIGSGLGGGIVTNGRLVTGANQAAAMIGHLSLDPSGWECRCGNRGCAETIISGPGLVRLVAKHSDDSTWAAGLVIDEALEPQAIVAAARQGNDLAQFALAEMGRSLGIVLSTFAALLNPARIVIGGGLGRSAFDLLLPPAWEELIRRTIPANRQNLMITVSELKSPSLGASAVAWYDRGFQI